MTLLEVTRWLVEAIRKEMHKPIPLNVDLYPPSRANGNTWCATVDVPNRGRGWAQAVTLGQAVQDAIVRALINGPNGSNEYELYVS